MSAFPDALQRWSFSGTCDTTGAVIGGTGANASLNPRRVNSSGTIVTMTTADVPIYWEIKNDEASADLYVLFGSVDAPLASNQTAVTTAAAGAALALRQVVKAGQAYSEYVRDPRQQRDVRTSSQETEESHTGLVIASATEASHAFSGMVYTMPTPTP